MTGTPGNDEALFITPTNDIGVSVGDLEGALFTTETPITFNSLEPGKVVYVQYETFSDISAFADQYFKAEVRFGLGGDGASYGLFDSSRSAEWLVNTNYNTEPTGQNQQGRAATGPTTNVFSDIRYDGDSVQPGGANENIFLDDTSLMSVVYRPVEGGTNIEGQNDNGSEIRTGEALDGDPNGSPPTNIRLTPEMGSTIDRIIVHMRRHVGFYN